MDLPKKLSHRYFAGIYAFFILVFAITLSLFYNSRCQKSTHSENQDTDIVRPEDSSDNLQKVTKKIDIKKGKPENKYETSESDDKVYDEHINTALSRQDDLNEQRINIDGSQTPLDEAIEEAHLGNVVGAYSLCGAVAGSRNWDGALDLRLIYDVVAMGIDGAEIPGGAEGLPEGSTLTATEIAWAVNVATGILLPPDNRTQEQAANLAKILNETQIPESFLLKDMLYATQNMSDLVHDTHKLNGRLGTGNADVVYDDEAIDDIIARVSPHPGAEKRLERYFTPTGDVGDTKIISIHTDKDGLVIVENESEYASVVPIENLTVAIVVEDVPTHCDFTAAEALAGWESLRAWIAGFPQPSALTIQLTCLSLSPTVPEACRIDPTFEVPNMDWRIRPR